MVSLQPRMPFKSISRALFFLCILFSAQSFAQTDEINQCRIIQDPSKRLACYDNLYGRINADVGIVSDASNKGANELDPIEQRAQALMSKSTSTSPFDNSSSRIDSSSSKVAPNDDRFGAEQIDQAASTDSDRMMAIVDAIDTNQRNLRTISLTNGQVWRELQTSRLDIDIGEQIIIKKGLIGGYLLSTDSSNRTSRVRRVE